MPRPASTATSSTSSVTAPARRRCARRSSKRAPSSPCRFHRRRAPPATTTQPKRHAAFGASAARSAALMPSAICTRAGCRAAASRRCAITPSFAIAKARRCAGFRRWSPPSPAMTAPCSACSAPGSIRARPPRRASRTRARRSGGSSVMRSASAPSPATASDLPGRPRRRRHQHGHRLAPGEAHGERQVGGHRQHEQARQREPDVPHPAQGGVHVAAPHQPTYRRRWLGGVALRRSTKSGRNQ